MVPLAVADALALAAFVLGGVGSHHDTGAVAAFLRNAVPLEIAWFVVGSVAGAYRRPGLRTLVWTWGIGVPLGLLARTLWVGSPAGVRLLTFLGVGLAFTFVLLLAGRALVVLAGRRTVRGRTKNMVR